MKIFDIGMNALVLSEKILFHVVFVHREPVCLIFLLLKTSIIVLVYSLSGIKIITRAVFQKVGLFTH